MHTIMLNAIIIVIIMAIRTIIVMIHCDTVIAALFSRASNVVCTTTTGEVLVLLHMYIVLVVLNSIGGRYCVIG